MSVEETSGIPPVLFCLIHRHIGPLEDIFRIAIIIDKQHNADTRRAMMFHSGFDIFSKLSFQQCLLQFHGAAAHLIFKSNRRMEQVEVGLLKAK